MDTHILLVEPDTESAAHFRDSVASGESRVTVAHSNVDAVTLLQAGVQPDIGLIAWDGDSNGGLELVRQLREYLPHLPVLLVLPEGKRSPPEISALGVQGVISRPVSFSTLPEVLQKAMDEAADVLDSLQLMPPASGEVDIVRSLAALLDEPLSDHPPPGGHVELTQERTAQLADELQSLGKMLNLVPLILSQDGTLLAHAGRLSADSAAAIARLAGRMWREGATSPARECLCFKDQIPGEGTEGRAVALFSVIVAGGLTLTVPWDGKASFSALRSDTLDAAAALGGLLA